MTEINREEAEQIIGKVQSGGTLTDDEVEYLMMVAKAAIKKLPYMPGSWFLVLISSLVYSVNGMGLIGDFLDAVFEDEE